MATYEVLKPRFESAGQGHVFAFWDTLSDAEKANLLADLNQIDPARVSKIFKTATNAPPLTAENSKIEPLPESAVDSVLKSTPEKVKAWRETGLRLISQGKVAVLLLAGGQGTRLGSSAPKGCYDIQLPSHKSLFQLQGERILRLQKVAKDDTGASADVVIPWYVMTSAPTRAATESFFREHKFFGLKEENVFFFNQGILPAFSNEGKILLETKSSVAVAPDGNGGIYAALRKEGVIADLERRGIPYIHAYCVDNCLVKVADPVFIGAMVERNADSGVKVVPKAYASEPVGVICRRNGRFGVVEYSEIDPKMAEQTKPDGSLVFNAANVANHYYTLDFLKKIDAKEDELEFHVAKKKIKHVEVATGAEIKPEKPNGIKLELFIFDVIPFAERFAVLENARNEEFSPLKNAPGTPAGDNPETSRADILTQHHRFAVAAGAKIADGVEVELSPLVTYDGEGLEALRGVTISKSAHVSNEADLKTLA
ncbi:nucleotide-diphospho-sugar transferase [Cladochytrium replicatum]|nr:nucleotide-diphospho-sugar transferase [Cladochytrium replicatum]